MTATRTVYPATTQLTELFRMLVDPTRVRTFYALAAAGELCVCGPRHGDG